MEERGGACDDASDIAIRLRVLAGEIYNMQTSLEWLQRQLFPSTASGEYLDKLAEQRGLRRREAEKASGTLTFRVAEVKTTAVTIPRGTVVSTDTESPVRVYTTEDSELPPATFSVTVPAEAETAGFRGNIGANTAVLPVSMPSGLDSVTNMHPFTGGRNTESDELLRGRLRDSYFNQPNGMNAAYYIALATSVEGIVKAGVVAQARGTGTVGVYVRGTAEVLPDSKITEVQSVIDAAKALNVRVYVERAYGQSYDMDVSVVARPGYNEDEVKTMCTDAFAAYLESIPIGGKLYTALLGKYLLDTGCVETYTFSQSMTDVTVPGSAFFVPGDVYIEVN